MSIIRPVVDGDTTIYTLTLYSFIFVIQRGGIFSTTVGVCNITRVFSIRYETFSVPTKTSLTPEQVPMELTKLDTFPRDGVGQVFFGFTSNGSNTTFGVFGQLVEGLTMFLGFGYTRVGVIFDLVDVTFFGRYTCRLCSFVSVFHYF